MLLLGVVVASPALARTSCLGWGMLIAGPALALDGIPVNLFEMDGNRPVDAVTPPPYDWDNLGPASPTFDESDGQGGLVFTQGSKDIDDISEWKYSLKKTVTPKDDIDRVGGAAYTSTYAPSTGDTILYFYLKRFDTPQGTDSSGFWLLSGDVELTDDTFADDQHKMGDTLIVVDTQGQLISGIRVFKWAGADGPSGYLSEVLSNGVVPDCRDATVSDGHYQTPVCGRVNPNDETFLEIAVNGSDLELGCFGNVLATTRTSNQTKEAQTAALKNFHLAGFPLCDVKVTKTCDEEGEGSPVVAAVRCSLTSTCLSVLNSNIRLKPMRRCSR